MLVLIAIIVGVVAMVSVFVIYQPPAVTHVVTVTTSESNISVSVVDDLTVTGELDMTSKSQPLLPPRVTTSEMNAMTTSQGALVYNTEENNVYIFDGTTWVIVGSPSSVFDPVMVYATRTAGNYNADTTIVFNNQLLDNNNAYDNTTGIFTVPVGKGGTYEIFTRYVISIETQRVIVYLSKNDSTILASSYTNSSPFDDYDNSSLQWVGELMENDNIRVVIDWQGTPGFYLATASFSNAPNSVNSFSVVQLTN